MTPWPLFLACWYPTNIPLGTKAKPTKVERYFLGWHRHLYDTFGLYHGLTLAENVGVEALELPAGGRPLAAPAAGRPEGASATFPRSSPTTR